MKGPGRKWGGGGVRALVSKLLDHGLFKLQFSG